MQNTFQYLFAVERLKKAKVIFASSCDVTLWCKAKVAFSLTSGLEPVSFIFTSSRGVTNLVQSQSCVFLLPKLEPLSFVFASSRDVTLYLLKSKVAFFLLRGWSRKFMQNTFQYLSAGERLKTAKVIFAFSREVTFGYL